jgi:hypothetical protein
MSLPLATFDTFVKGIAMRKLKDLQDSGRDSL